MKAENKFALDLTERKLEHSKNLSPSSFPALAHCIFYDSTSRKISFGETGKSEHKLLEVALTNGFVALSQALDPKEDNLEALDRVKFAYEIICGETYERYVEEKLTLYDEDGKEITFGTADVVGFGKADGKPLLKILDYKSGDVVDCRLQLFCYALAAMQRFDCDRAECFAIFGRLQYVRKWEVTRGTATALIHALIKQKINRSDVTDKHNPNRYCKYCEHLTKGCPVIAKIITSITEAESNWKLENYKHETNVCRNGEVAGKMYRLANLLIKYSEHVKEDVKSFMQDGNDVEGFELAERTGKKSVPDIVAAFKAVEVDGLKFMSACTLSIPKLAKVYATEKTLSLKIARKEVESDLGKLIEVGEPTQIIKEEK